MLWKRCGPRRPCVGLREAAEAARGACLWHGLEWRAGSAGEGGFSELRLRTCIVISLDSLCECGPWLLPHAAFFPCSCKKVCQVVSSRLLCKALQGFIPITCDLYCKSHGFNSRNLLISSTLFIFSFQEDLWGFHFQETKSTHTKWRWFLLLFLIFNLN